MLVLSDEVIKIRNIGTEKAKKLNKLGIFNVNDLIEYFPREYDDRSNITPLCEVKSIGLGNVFTIKGRVINAPEISKVKNFDILKVRIKDGEDFIEIVWFNQSFLKNVFKLNADYMFTGKIIENFGRIQMKAPDYEIIDSKELLSNGRIVPIYSSTHKFSQKLFRSIINDTFKEINGQIAEFLPKSLFVNMCSREFAVKNIHFPENNDSFLKARYRLVFEELFLLQMKLLQLRGNLEKKNSNIILDNLDIKPILEKIPFELTNAQKKVLKDIQEDIVSGKAMNRLVQGDVGSGKTAVFQVVSYILVNNGYQVAVMSPTEVLASQHLKSFESLFSELDLKCVFLAGSQTAKQKREAYALIESGEANIVIGTHALIQEKVKFSNLGLVVTDEQHRFGVKQRENLSKKGDSPHTLVMTATPIPRTLALILYGDLDISIIDELPPNREPIHTSYVNTSYYPRVYNFLKNNADEKRQAYIICPMIEESDKSELKSVLEYTEKLKKEIFFDYTIECIHGKMKNTEKNEIMQRFANGEIDILVSTTVIEVGINVPNSTIMVIENAERFGISQLHQLRGRVGRGSEKSYCILISDTKNKQTIQRLKTMVQYSDGFILSEKDLQLRGSGDFFGTRQHGVPEMKIANLYKDMDILKDVQEKASDLYKLDPLLENVENASLKYKLSEFFKSVEVTTL